MIQINSQAEVSPEAQQILKTGIGYRCEDQATGDYHYPKEVVAFEENELGNTDIGDTLLKFYNFKFNDQLGGTAANPGVDAEMTQKLSNFLFDNLGGDFDLIWLATDLDAIREFYSDEKLTGERSAINTWKFNHTPFMIISDLGVDGQLIAYRSNDDRDDYEIEEQ